MNIRQNIQSLLPFTITSIFLISLFVSTVKGQDKLNVGTSSVDSLSVDQAISMALKNNYGITIQRKNVEISRIENHWGETGALPTISLSGSGGYQDQNDISGTNYSGTVNLDWTIFRGFGARIEKEMLEQYQKLSEGNMAINVENAVIDIILSYYNILLQLQNMELANDLMQLSEDRYDLAKRRKEIGSSVTYDLLQAQNAYLEDKSNYLSAKTSYHNAMRELNYLMAAPLEKNYQLISEFQADTTSFNRKTLADRMLQNNNNLRNQYINLELARQQTKLARSNYYPTVSIGASGGYSGSGYDIGTSGFSSQTGSGLSHSASLTVSYTLFNGGQRKRVLEAAQIEKQISEVETSEMEASLKNQLFQEHELYQLRKEQLELAHENLEAAELNLKISKKKFESGSINSFIYRDVQQVYSNADVNYNRAIYNVIESYHTLMRLTGGIIDDE
ncbi:TolC family protein [Gracilimonas mengyeensis]|uniref:Outer membrane protein TolC n=1 Tax=Gracilimonas mengyeensis TaxID=1302730 RepID=A0A521BV42_9BACT|nr:TolC family protein [Gracilimonas mengyeensis]SMO51052.1 Outer membrane protein TolC [Gracilimonas mengyeensis]